MARSTRPTTNGVDIDREIERAEAMAEMATILKGVVKAVDEQKQEFKDFKKAQEESRREMRKWALGILATIIGAIVLRYLKLG